MTSKEELKIDTFLEFQKSLEIAINNVPHRKRSLKN